MWLSCSSFFQQFFHCYCPVGFGRRTDPNGDYIRRYLPILRGFPAKFIYDPWNAPESVQKVAKCIIGVHYPKPMVNHAEASRINIERMKQIYQQLSCYRGLGLLATIPSNTANNEDSNGAGPSSGDTQERTHITVHTLPASSQSEFPAFAVSCGQQLVNSVQPQPGYSGAGMVGQAHKQTQRVRGMTAFKRHGEDRTTDFPSKIQRNDCN